MARPAAASHGWPGWPGESNLKCLTISRIYFLSFLQIVFSLFFKICMRMHQQKYYLGFFTCSGRSGTANTATQQSGKYNLVKSRMFCAKKILPRSYPPPAYGCRGISWYYYEITVYTCTSDRSYTTIVVPGLGQMENGLRNTSILIHRGPCLAWRQGCRQAIIIKFKNKYYKI